MVSAKITAAALVLPLIAGAMLSDKVDHKDMDELVARIRNDRYVVDGRYEIPVAKFCGATRSWSSPFSSWLNDKACTYTSQLAADFHRRESVMFCSHIGCDVKYDPLAGLCQCSWARPEQMIEENVWPDKDCKQSTKCYAPYEPHWDPSLETCTCAVGTFPVLRSALVVFEPNSLKERLYGTSQYKVTAPSLEEQSRTFKHDLKQIEDHLSSRKDAVIDSWRKTYNALKDVKMTLAQLIDTIDNVSKARNRRTAHSTTISLAPLPTYIPPPNTEVTQELLQESLLIQPQQVATVGSVIPQFADGLITFLVQLDGPISQTLALNAPDTLPCETIGTDSRPNLILVPQNVKNGSSETILPDCLIIAVNVYSPKYITYWVQKEDGSVYSLLSDNKIHAIDQLNTTLPASIAIRVAPLDKDTKRDLQSGAEVATLKRRQIFSVACDKPCPFYHMDRIAGADGYCGCIFKGADQDVDLTPRGVEPASQYTATMTAEACAAMTCNNNGAKPALFNPFTAACWCASPTFVEVNENAYNGKM